MSRTVKVGEDKRERGKSRQPNSQLLIANLLYHLPFHSKAPSIWCAARNMLWITTLLAGSLPANSVVLRCLLHSCAASVAQKHYRRSTSTS